MARVLICLLVLGGVAAASTYKAPAEVAKALATFRAAYDKPGTPAEQPAIEAARVIFERVPLVGMASGEVRELLGAPSEILVIDGDPRWRYLRHDGEGGGALLVLRVHEGRIATVVSFPTQ
jgi:hypothetical protein